MKPRIQAAWAGGLALVAAVLLFALHPWLLDRSEFALLDARFRLRGTTALENPIVIVAIDSKSIDEIGRWPWRRSTIAELVNRLTEAGALAIGLDLVFSEKETPRDIAAVRVARDILRERVIQEPGVATDIAALDEALARSRRTALGYFFRTALDEADAPDELARRIPGIRRSQVSVAKVPAQATPPVLTCTGLEANLPQLQTASRRSGFLSAVNDFDGVTRRAALIARCGDAYYVSLALAVYEVASGKRTMLLGNSFGFEEIRVGERAFPVDEGGKILINYRGPARTFPHISASDVLAGRVRPGELSGALVLVGPTEIGLGDLQTTPLGGAFPGVEVHANVLDNVMNGDVLERNDSIVAAELGLIVFLGTLLIVVIPRTRGILMSLACAGALATGLLSFGFFAFLKWGLWLNLIYPLTTIALVFLAVEATRSLAAEARSRRVRSMFATYVPPSVVKQLADDETRLQLGGETRTLSILFSDVRDFTSLSERLGAEDTIKLMNVYLGAMTKIIFDTEGTLDKYIGDAVMAFWGAPVPLANHPERACRAAIAMQSALQDFAAEHPGLQGAEAVRVGIGVHTDTVMVGNVGSQLRFDYTLIGDGVNLCSRLEGLSKVYGAGILASQDLVGQLPASFKTREIDEIRVKGRQTPAVIHEVLGSSPWAQEEAAWRDAHALGLAQYRAGRWAEARRALEEAVALRGHDGPSTALLERMRALDETPPSAWDGIWSFETK